MLDQARGESKKREKVGEEKLREKVAESMRKDC